MPLDDETSTALLNALTAAQAAVHGERTHALDQHLRAPGERSTPPTPELACVVMGGEAPRVANDEVFCSFCGKNRRALLGLVKGPAVYICDECFDECAEHFGEVLGVPGTHAVVALRECYTRAAIKDLRTADKEPGE